MDDEQELQQIHAARRKLDAARAANQEAMNALHAAQWAAHRASKAYEVSAANVSAARAELTALEHARNARRHMS